MGPWAHVWLDSEVWGFPRAQLPVPLTCFSVKLARGRLTLSGRQAVTHIDQFDVFSLDPGLGDGALDGQGAQGSGSTIGGHGASHFAELLVAQQNAQNAAYHGAAAKTA